MSYEFLAESMLIFAVNLPSGLKKNVAFDRCSDRVYRFTTTDPDVAMAIKRHPLTKKGRIVDQSLPEEEQVNKVEKKMADDENIMRFDNITKAKNYLKRTYGVSTTNLKSPESVRNKAKEFGLKIDF